LGDFVSLFFKKSSDGVMLSRRISFLAETGIETSANLDLP